jgi:tetratricopeptide (TPR) repeat protein
MDHRQQKLWQRGLAYFRAGSLEASQACFDSILARDPGHGPAKLRLSMIAARRGRAADAVLLAEQALATDPQRPEILAHLARCQLLAGDLGQARHAAERALQHAELEPVVLDSLGIVLSQIGETQRAIGLFDRAIERQPQQASLYYNRAVALRACQRLDEAEHDLEACLALSPEHGKANWALAILRRPGQATDRGRRAERLQRALARQPGVDESSALALFTELDAAGRHAEAWPILESVLRQRRQMAPADTTGDLFKLLAAPLPSADALELTAQGAIIPVFVIGLPRAGTALLGKLLDRHSQASATQPQAGKRIRHALSVGGTRALDSRLLARALQLDRRALAAACRDGLAAVEPDKRFACDHQPMDFLLFELLASALPEAKFLHVSRDPLDTLLSCLAQPNGETGLPVHDPVALADYFAAEASLVTRWQKHWPGRILDVHYESLVEKPEMVLRVACAFLGVRYEASMRSAVTLDSLSEGRWLHYATPLEGARLRLEALGLSG